MLDFSLSELLVVGIVAVMCVKPEDMPGLMRKAGRITGQARRQFNDAWNEFKMLDINDTEKRMVKGDDGKMYEAYDATTLEHFKNKKDEGKPE